jgi:hypothetical protein
MLLIVDEAIPLAFGAAIYPPALLAVVALLAGGSPLRRSLAYLSGAFLCTLGVGIAVVAVLQTSDLVAPDEDETPHAWIQLILGVALLVLAAYLWFRPEKTKSSDDEAPPDESAKLGRVFVLGAAMYTPGFLYLSALTALASSQDEVASVGLSLVVLAVIVLLAVEIPIVLYLLARDRFQAIIDPAMAWLHRHSRVLVVAISIVIGIALIAQGISQLV